MMRLALLENVDLDPHWNDEIDNKLAMKHQLLFAKVQNKPCAVVQKSSLSSALNYFAKLDIDYPIV
ncbi:MAG: Type IV fimbrial assembly, ATPase PilB, partial [uncultured Sulfurovum sp.]